MRIAKPRPGTNSTILYCIHTSVLYVRYIYNRQRANVQRNRPRKAYSWPSSVSCCPFKVALGRGACMCL